MTLHFVYKKLLNSSVFVILYRLRRRRREFLQPSNRLGFFVGRGVGTEGISAVNIVAPVFMVITGIGLMFGIGASVIASIRLSENKVKAASIIMTQAFIVGLLIVGVIGLGSFVCPRGVVHALGCSPLLEDNAVSYLLWLLSRAFGVPGLWLAIPAAVLLTCAVIYIRYASRNWRKL